MKKEPKLNLSVMLVDNEPARAAILEQALLDAGYRISARLEDTSELTEEVRLLQPDIVIIDIESPDRDTMEDMSRMHKDNPRPVVMFSEQDDEKTIASAIRAGVSAYIADDIQATRVKPILDVAIARFREFHALRDELDKVRNQLADRKLIEKAKGLLMQHQECNEEEAYKALRKMAMDQSKRLTDVAKNVISVLELVLNTPNSKK